MVNLDVDGQAGTPGQPGIRSRWNRWHTSSSGQPGPTRSANMDFIQLAKSYYYSTTNYSILYSEYIKTQSGGQGILVISLLHKQHNKLQNAQQSQQYAINNRVAMAGGLGGQGGTGGGKGAGGGAGTGGQGGSKVRWSGWTRRSGWTRGYNGVKGVKGSSRFWSAGRGWNNLTGTLNSLWWSTWHTGYTWWCRDTWHTGTAASATQGTLESASTTGGSGIKEILAQQDNQVNLNRVVLLQMVSQVNQVHWYTPGTDGTDGGDGTLVHWQLVNGYTGTPGGDGQPQAHWHTGQPWCCRWRLG